jgi:hypothetical protein
MGGWELTGPMWEAGDILVPQFIVPYRLHCQTDALGNVSSVSVGT